ncbi:phosphonate C-P lyase system protein PhnG [Azoarcus sp. L1K30]|uniref:phosphonate C-P lyase system protein PhnG n=1 Tax=Azoarcus sp. L1K30 TaxID=2820277 RepID=UPI001B84564C|nr:phosphonate C-P lyase system protein PhnG [Azoarcus sp. L1K30]MBR0568204.1 phosphonate C-P lyase system protein PhnG [Azoarcus sp. L1K30]
MNEAAPDVSRRLALGVLACAPAPDLADCVRALGELPRFTWLRQPETGLVMLRARIGGNGARFNLGEASVTRCTLRLADGSIGVGTVRGRNPRHAEHVAICDALLQHPEYAGRVQAQVIDVLVRAEQARHARRSVQVSASKVDFFTLVRGED